MQYKQRLQRTEKKQKATTSNQSERLATTSGQRQITEAATRLLKTAQRYRAVQTDRAMTDDVMDLFVDQGLLL
jgi:hypothetical protein